MQQNSQEIAAHLCPVRKEAPAFTCPYYLPAMRPTWPPSVISYLRELVLSSPTHLSSRMGQSLAASSAPNC